MRVQQTRDAVASGQLVFENETIAEIATHYNFKVSTISNPENVANALATLKPDFIMLDLMMPYQNGFNVLDELQSDEDTRDIPVVIQTSKALTQIDYERLGSRQATILPKAGNGRVQALTTIREILGEPDLFREEPEFLTSGQTVS